MFKKFTTNAKLTEATDQAVRDANIDVYAPERFIKSLGLRDPGKLNDSTNLQIAKSNAQSLIVEISATHRVVRDEVLTKPPRRSRQLIVIALFIAEWFAIIVFFVKEQEFAPTQAFFMSSLLTPASFYLTHLVRKYTFGSDRRWWAYALLLVYVIFAVSLTFLRATANSNSDTGLAYSLAMGVILCLATLLPGWLTATMTDDVAQTTPLVRREDELKLRLEQHQGEIAKVTSTQETILDHETLLEQLTAAYDIAHDQARAQLGKPRLTGGQETALAHRQG